MLGFVEVIILSVYGDKVDRVKEKVNIEIVQWNRKGKLEGRWWGWGDIIFLYKEDFRYC